MSEFRVLEGEAADVLRTLPAASVQTVITSPPYWGLRDYGTATWQGGQDDHQHVGTRRVAITRGTKGRPSK